MDRFSWKKLSDDFHMIQIKKKFCKDVSKSLASKIISLKLFKAGAEISHHIATFVRILFCVWRNLST